MLKNNGTSMLFDGQDIWLQPEDSLYEGARFDALTWSYFFMTPFKLNEPGTYHSAVQSLPYTENQALKTNKMTFGENVGDAPDDWYMIYQNSEIDLLEAMSYIVTFDNRNAEKAA
ncbi:hypothetical protein [uncultured Marivirga sp.]|uniref:hypothetical protein n=1 Tax=uncultured Marivirga sp. TaxID=1123707 RepID=UPI0030ED239C